MHAKASYFHKLNPSNPKQIWKAVKFLNKKSMNVPTPSHDEVQMS